MMTEPAQVDKQRVARTFEAAAAGYDADNVVFFTTLGGRLVELAGLRRGERVLDAGCGAGACLFPAAEAVGPDGRVIGIDMSQGMIERTSAEIARRGLGHVEVRLGDAERPPFAESGFDAIVASMVMFLLSDRVRTAGRYLRLLRPGGRFAMTWNVREDPRWRDVYSAVDAHAPGGQSFDGFLRPWPLTDPGTVETMLTGQGYAGVETRIERIQTRYQSAAQWWQVSWNQAPRYVWDQIPGDERDTARDSAFSRLESLRRPDGSLIREMEIGYTVATAPG